MDKFLKKIGSGFKKVGQKYKEISSKNPSLDTVLTISGVIIFSFLVVYLCQDAMNGSVITIATNKAEESYYEKNYDIAEAEYQKLQEGDEWPIYKVKLAGVKSVKGEYVQSNILLEEAFDKRNELIEKNGNKEYNDVDGDLGNEIAFTALMNGDYGRSLEYGEIFRAKNKSNKSLDRTMFTIYMVNNMTDKAKEIIESYQVDRESAYDLALYARMYMLVDNWDKGFKTLKEAWYKDKDEIKVYDVIAQIAAYNRNDVIEKIAKLSKDNPKEVVYKVWLTKCYSMLEETTEEANNLLKEIENENLGTIAFKTVKSKIYQHSDRQAEAEGILNSIINSDNTSYIRYHTAALYYLDMGDYDKAFELCKQSILENKDYPDNYSFLIPEIMMKKEQSEVAEPYFRTALLKEPFNYNIMIKIADYYNYTENNLDKAYEYYNLASLVRPNDAEINYNMALIKLNQSRVNDAIKLLENCIKIDETTGKYHRTLGTVYLDEEKNEEAIKEIREAYAVDKSDIRTLNNAGIYYISIEGDVERGMSNLEGAYNRITSTVDEETKNTITENYNKAKEIYDAYKRNDRASINIPNFTLLY